MPLCDGVSVDSRSYARAYSHIIMKYILRACCLASLPIAFSVALGQLPSIRFDRLYPPSAKQGSELEVTVAGTDLEG